MHFVLFRDKDLSASFSFKLFEKSLSNLLPVILAEPLVSKNNVDAEYECIVELAYFVCCDE